MGKSNDVLKTVWQLVGKLRLDNITSKLPLFCGSENCIINKRGAQEVKATRILFLRPLMELQTTHRQRSSNTYDTKN